MSKFIFVTPVIAGLALASGMVQATSPQPLYGASVKAYGGAVAVATTSGTGNFKRAGYVVAAISGSTGALEVTAWQDTTKELSPIGSPYNAGGDPIAAVAAADLDATHVITTDVDENGVLHLKTWTVGGKAGIALANDYHSAPNTANPLGSSPALGVAALSATQIVVAYTNFNVQLVLQAWTVGDSSAAPVPAGASANGGAVNKVAIAALDSQTVITASSDANNDLVITTWGIDSSGVHMQDQYTKSNIVDAMYSSVAIAAGSVYVIEMLPGQSYTSRTAVTPIVNNSGDIQVLYWQISTSGKISLTADEPAGGFALGTAACMLPTSVPMSVYGDLGLVDNDSFIHVGVYGLTEEATLSAIDGYSDAIDGVTAAVAGESAGLTPLDNAYFVTGTLTSTKFLPAEPSSPGTFELQMWSYPVPGGTSVE